ncbi:MAG TPA: penicillin-binding protein 2 [Symbiobacteriaceae bacterium]|nr:penicillin-binding protein 2 [Symbiobacteriaceae bacterium]
MNNRVVWVLGVLAAGLILLTAQLFRLTVAQSAQWMARGTEQRLQELSIYAPRGAIYDAKGRALATSEPAFAAVLISQDLAAIRKVMPKLSQVLAGSDEARAEEITNRVIRRVADNAKNFRLFEPVVIERNLSPAVVTALTERKAEFPGILVLRESSRLYPNGALGGILVGFVGSITDEELAEQQYEGYRTDEMVGKAGLELYYEQQLRGEHGKRTVQINWLGHRVGEFEDSPPVPGNNLYLTLDLELQRVAETALVKQMDWIRKQNKPRHNPIRGAVVVQDVRTGAILAMATYPGYDPNIMIRALSDAEWNALQNRSDFSQINWALKGIAPGSTYKMATGFAGLESKTVGPYETIPCPPEYWNYDKPDNWKPYDDGDQEITKALATSCNPYFYEVGHRAGIESLNKYYDLLGFGRQTGIDLPGESAGNNPTEQSYGDRWWPGNVLRVAIGQGDVLVTPLQLANYTATVATGGIRYRPYLVSEVRSPAGATIMRQEPTPFEPVPAEKSTWQLLQQGMRRAAATPEGTAYASFLNFPVSVAAKTGSAQTGREWDDATSVAYAPYENPEIAVSVWIEGGSTGSWSTPIIRRVMASYFGIADKIPTEVPTYQD